MNNKINSVQDMEIYLQNHPKGTGEILSLIRHLLTKQEIPEQIPTRDFLLFESQIFNAQFLPLDAREFIAKRLFAFWKKGQVDILQRNLEYFSQIEEYIKSNFILALLNFEELPLEIKEEILTVIEEENQLKDIEPNKTLTQILTEQKREVYKEVETETKIKKKDQKQISDQKKIEPQEEDSKKQISLKFSKEESPEFEEIVSHTKFQNETVPDLSKSSIPLVELSEKEELQIYIVENEDKLNKQYDFLETFSAYSFDLKAYKDFLIPKLESMSIQHLIRVINGIMHRYLHSTKEKYPLMRLKDTIVKYQKMLTSEETILIIVNYGYEMKHELLKKFSKLSNLKKLNEVIYKYMDFILSSKLDECAKDFRSDIEQCFIKQDLLKLLSKYPLYKDSIVKYYPKLGIIKKLKHICEEIQKNPDKVDKILNRTLAKGEANIKHSLQNALVRNVNSYKIEDKLDHVYDINTLFKLIKDLKKEPDMLKTSTTLLQMIITFLRGKQTITFQTFQVSLNFLAPSLQNKVIQIMKKKLKKDLKEKMRALLSTKEAVEQKWENLMKLLRNHKYYAKEITLFSYPVPELIKKINIIINKKDTKSIKKYLNKDSVPESLIILITSKLEYMDKKEEKTIHSCYKELLSLNKELMSDKILSLRRPLGDIFQCYGEFNFSQNNSKKITGYDVSRAITRFYSNPVRVRISLTQFLIPDFSILITSMIQFERKRQVKKMR